MSLSQRINLDIVLMNGIFNTWVKIKDDDPYMGELVEFMFLCQIYDAGRLHKIQSAIRKPNSDKLHFTTFQRIGLDHLVNNLKKYKLEKEAAQ